MSLNLLEFRNFLKENDVVKYTLYTIIAGQVGELVGVFTNDVIAPIIHIDSNQDGIEDIRTLSSVEVKILGARIKIGKLLMNFIKFVIVIYITFLLSQMIKIY